MAKPVSLSNGSSWCTQKEAKAHFIDMLNRHVDGQQIADPEDHAELLALLTQYDTKAKVSGQTKIGSGVRYFFRDRDQEHGGTTSCFFVERLDGTKIDFSFHRAVETASR